MNGTVLYLLSGNLSTTPRALQSIRTASHYPWRVKVLSINRHQKWAELDKQLAEDLQIEFYSFPISGKNIFYKIAFHFIFKMSAVLFRVLKRSLRFAAWSSEKASIVLCIEAKKHLQGVNLICAYGYGAMYPAYFQAYRKRLPFMTDVEDYYPGEISNTYANIGYNKRKLLLSNIVKKASAFTFASPLIGEYTKALVNEPLPFSDYIANAFPKAEFNPVINLTPNPKILKLVWFSQNIDFGRGLEWIIPALARYKTEIELTLIGNLNASFSVKCIQGNESWIHTFPPLIQTVLHRKLSDYHIGLALETGSFNLNRNICLTNKILAYVQAGLYILATDTSGQKQFMQENPDSGIVCGQSEAEIFQAIDTILANKMNIFKTQIDRISASQKYSWEIEQTKLINLWKKVLNEDF